MPKLSGRIVKYPARASFIWYSGLILLGSLALLHPVCRTNSAVKISVLDSVFTSTSAACVTGLAVRSTENDFSFLGQAVILLLIQLGGIGIMTVTTFVLLSFGRGASLRSRLVIRETLGGGTNSDLGWILRRVLLITAISEGVGFLILAVRFLFQLPFQTALWHALFHSISAFCNAGFALHDDSLSLYRTDPIVNLTVSALIVVGGLGFPVILDLERNWNGTLKDRWLGLGLHSKIMLIGTTALLAFGFCSFLGLEWNGVLKDDAIWSKPFIALFYSASCRTAGFNTVDLTQLSEATIFFTILLMIVGAGPCSTGGGFKVSSMMVLVLRAWSTFRGRRLISVFRRTIPDSVTDRTTTTGMIFGTIAALALTMLLLTEEHFNSQAADEFLAWLFEVVSALGTVGLSLSKTSDLSVIGRVIIIVLMILGRLGPISVFVAFSKTERNLPIEYSHEEPLIG
ncbi:MAG: hypothetical protein KDA87_05655 [Planctomycetales bacterium]|nr:hypothetical protein [Planctomycetales bacterium]